MKTSYSAGGNVETYGSVQMTFEFDVGRGWPSSPSENPEDMGPGEGDRIVCQPWRYWVTYKWSGTISTGVKFDFTTSFGGLKITTKLEFIYTFTTETSIKVELNIKDEDERIKFYIVSSNAIFGSGQGTVYDFTFWFIPL